MMKFILVVILVATCLFSCGKRNDPRALKLMEEGSIFLDNGDFSNALLRFRKAFHYDLATEESSHNYRNLAVTFLYLDQVDSAKHYSKLGMNCTLKKCYYHLINMAEYELLCQKPHLAVHTFEEAKKMNPEEPEVYVNLSMIYAGNYDMKLQNLDLALKNAQKALKLEANAINREQVAEMYLQLKNQQKAENSQQKIGSQNKN